jgi:hypothetical protein
VTEIRKKAVKVYRPVYTLKEERQSDNILLSISSSEQRAASGKACGVCSGVNRMEFRLGHRLSWQSFRGFP